MEITIKNTAEDWKLLNDYATNSLIKDAQNNPVTKAQQRKDFFFSFGFFFVLILVGLQVIEKIDWSTAVFVSLLFIMFIITRSYDLKQFNKRLLAESTLPNESSFYIDRKYTFNKNGINVVCDVYEATYSWDMVTTIEKSTDCIFLFLDKHDGFVFPDTQLDSLEELYTYINSLWTEHNNALK